MAVRLGSLSDIVVGYHESMRTANPAFTDSTFPGYANRAGYGDTMTIAGTINRTGILLICVLATAMFAWSQFYTTRDPAMVGPYVLIGGIGGFIMAMVTIFKKEWSG